MMLRSPIHKKYFHLVALVLLTTPFLTRSMDSSVADPAHKQYPIVLVHGILGDSYNMEPTVNFLTRYLPGVYVKSVTLGLGKVTSFWNMLDQIEWLKREIQSDPMLAGGCHIIAHSQGGLVARAFVEKYNFPKVHALITWGTPHRGVYGTPGTMDDRFAWLNWMESYASILLYSSKIQKYISFAGYWCDTLNYGHYLDKCKFLPYINNEKEHFEKQMYKDNICSLDNFVVVESDKEDIVEPACSCSFGFYKRWSKTEFEDVFASEIYQNDTLGLKTLYDSGRFHIKVAHCTHENFQEDEHNFVENTFPYIVPEGTPLPTYQPPVIGVAPEKPAEEPAQPVADAQTAQEEPAAAAQA